MPLDPVNLGWPIWARIIARRRLPGERGLGDTAERLHGVMGGQNFATWHYCVFGPGITPDDCPRHWNARWPYPEAVGSHETV